MTRMLVALLVVLLLALAVGAVLWWGARLPPTRPRPGSRYRGDTYTTIHSRLQRRRR